MSGPHLEILKTMGIDVYVRRDQTVEEIEPPPEKAPKPVEIAPSVPPEAELRDEVPADSDNNDIARLEWIPLRERVTACVQCAELCANRTQTVFGVGNQRADLMVVGEAPGRDEDRQGEPFVGRAGQLLDRMLLVMGQERSRVYIANILKCRPPNNRDPKPEEADACRAFLERQIALVQPKVLLSGGLISAQNLLRTQQAVGRLRGRVHTLEPAGLPLIVTYHPAYLLRQPSEKRKVWDDLQRAMAVLDEVS